MKIVNKSETTKFRELKVGDVFQINNQYYMKVIFILDDNYDQVNAVCLTQNTLVHMRQDAEIKPIDCELVIK